MDQLAAFMNGVTKRLYQEDSIDRLNYHYTVWLLLAFAITLSAKQYVGEPIQCWVPAEFAGGWEQYTENYCFIENTYYVPMNEGVPEDVRDRERKEIAYYQWVPFVLALEALMFYLPHVIWRLLNWQSGIHLRGIITMAYEKRTSSSKDDRQCVDDICGHLYSNLQLHHPARGRSPITFSVLRMGLPNNQYLTVVYLFVKVLFIANLIGQFFLLNDFLGTSYSFWGASILNDILNNNDWQISGHFPRVTLCDFEVRRLANLHRYTVQCVLMINMFSEKIFLFIWWWFFVVTIITILNFFWWIYVTLSGESRRKYVEKLLLGYSRYDEIPITVDNLNNFVKYIGTDTVLILRLMANNAGDLITGRVCRALYEENSGIAAARREVKQSATK